MQCSPSVRARPSPAPHRGLGTLTHADTAKALWRPGLQQPALCAPERRPFVTLKGPGLSVGDGGISVQLPVVSFGGGGGGASNARNERPAGSLAHVEASAPVPDAGIFSFGLPQVALPRVELPFVTLPQITVGGRRR